MKWQSDCGYKLYGQYINNGDEQALFFDLSDPEITRFEQVEDVADVNAEIEVDHPQEVLITENKVWVAPESFGKTAEESAADYFAFKCQKYDDNWMIMKPTRVFRHCGNISGDTMAQLRKEAESLLMSLPAAN